MQIRSVFIPSVLKLLFFLWQCQVDEWLRDFTEEMAPGTQSEILAIYLAKHSAQLKLSYGELLYDLKIARH